MVGSPKKSRLLRWLHEKGGEGSWGQDPGAFDPRAVSETLDEGLGKLFGDGRYFPLEVEGLEKLPPAPVMVVMNHSGGTIIPDAWGFLAAWYRHFGTGRPLHPLAHELLVANRFTGPYFAARGVLHGGPAVAHETLTRWGRDVMVMPGGDQDTWRPWSDRWRVRFAGRVGYARTAIKAGVTIVPVAHAGAHETLIVLTDGQRIARAIGLHHIARADIFPIHLSLPFGLTVGPWPHIPVPARLRYMIGDPIHVPRDPSPSHDEVKRLDIQVRDAVQTGLDELRKKARKRSAQRA